MSNLPYAEDVNYWQTSQTSPDSWLEKTKKLIINLGGVVKEEAFGNEPASGRSAYMLKFTIKGDDFRVVWPVLPSYRSNEKAARIQAATLLYHDTKAKVLSAVILGAKAAFFSYLLLPDGRTAAEASLPELTKGIPAIFAEYGLQLTSGMDEDIIEGEGKLV